MSTQRGFTIVEMSIGLAIMAILIGLAAPSFSTMLRNWGVRGAADSMTAGLQLARAEAIKRNGDVHFALVSTDPATIAGTAAPTVSAQGPHWAVYAVSGGVYTLIDSRSQSNGTVSYTSATPGTTTAGDIVFDAMGRARELSASARFNVKGNEGSICQSQTSTQGIRCLDVVVSPAGGVRMCDPAVSASDSRACPSTS